VIYLNVIEIINTFAYENDIITGVCDASPLDSEQLTNSPFVPFVSSDLQRRVDPSVTLPRVKSIIAVGVEQSITGSNKNGTAQLSSLGTDSDYHIRVKQTLHNLKQELTKHITFKSKILVDSSGLDERAFAYRAGIGFFGRNGLIISEKFGSRFNIGLILTDIPLEKTSPQTKKSCPPGCSLCIDACPGAALGESTLNAKRCISYLTQKENLTKEEESLLSISNQLYGCDICQNICPLNTPRETYQINPKEWESMTDTDLKEKYSHTAMLWRGIEILRRNAHIITKNSK